MGPTYFPTTPSTQAAMAHVGCWHHGIDGHFIQFTKYKWTVLTCRLSVEYIDIQSSAVMMQSNIVRYYR